MLQNVIRRDTVWARVWEFMRESAAYAAGGFVLELASGGIGIFVGGAAFSAALVGKRRVYALGGAAFAALLNGFPAALSELCALGIVFLSQIIPCGSNRIAGSAVRGISVFMAVFFSRVSSASEPSQLVTLTISAAVSAVFAVCLYLLMDIVKLRGIDVSEQRDCALLAAVSALAFMSLAGLDYTAFNAARIILGFVMLTLTARRGIVLASVVGIPAVFGICAADAAIGCGAAGMMFSSLLSCGLSKYGKATRAIGYVFFGCAGMLLSAGETSPWKLFGELAVSGGMYALLPIESFGICEKDITDKTAAMMIRERLCFAADAISGVSVGLNAAADTLERRYSTTFAQVGDSAADRVCRSCPNSMVCWGQKYELFHAEFNRLVKLCRSGAELTEQSLSPLAAAECVNKPGVISAVKAAYLRYCAATADEQRVRELRRIYTEQLASVRDILEDMGYSVGRGGGKLRTAEKRAESVLKECGLSEPSVFISRDKKGRLLLEAYANGELKTDKEYLGGLLINALGREMELPEISGGSDRVRITSTERTQFSAEIGAFQLCKGKNRICGDCYESFTDRFGRLYIVLSDGMGSGSRARIDSALACSVITKLLKSGVSLGSALETVNTSLMVKSADESFATLDICRIDLNTGECMVFKAGAATTYIKCADRLVRASLSSPPAGTGGRLTVPAQKFTVGSGDVIIMTTDGASVDEAWLTRELSSKTTAQELSERIARMARSAENGREDDISVIAVTVGR
ncbi:MAG: SpoIIE family protein phosphatase [Oscillospiraceae bacterium]